MAVSRLFDSDITASLAEQAMQGNNYFSRVGKNTPAAKPFDLRGYMSEQGPAGSIGFTTPVSAEQLFTPTNSSLATWTTPSVTSTRKGLHETIAGTQNTDLISAQPNTAQDLLGLERDKLNLSERRLAYDENRLKADRNRDIFSGITGAAQLGLGVATFLDNKKTAKLQREGLKQDIALQSHKMAQNKKLNETFGNAFNRGTA